MNTTTTDEGPILRFDATDGQTFWLGRVIERTETAIVVRLVVGDIATLVSTIPLYRLATVRLAGIEELEDAYRHIRLEWEDTVLAARKSGGTWTIGPDGAADGGRS